MFKFERFVVDDGRSSMKVGTDAVILGAWTAIPCRARRIADVGCGCGVISLMLAQRSEVQGCDIYGFDIHAGSVADAAANFAASPWAPRLHAIEGDALGSGFPTAFDLIVSNPPYFTETLQSPDAARAAARHESALGIASLCSLAARSLAPGGSLAFIAPADRDTDVERELAMNRLRVTRRMRVRQRADRPCVRTLWQADLPSEKNENFENSESFENLERNEKIEQKCPREESELTLCHRDGSRTPAHTLLTARFYLR